MVKNGQKWPKMAGLTLSGLDIPAWAPEGREWRSQEARRTSSYKLGSGGAPKLPVIFILQHIISKHAKCQCLNLRLIIVLFSVLHQCSSSWHLLIQFNIKTYMIHLNMPPSQPVKLHYENYVNLLRLCFMCCRINQLSQESPHSSSFPPLRISSSS